MQKTFCDICEKPVGVFNSYDGIHTERKTVRKPKDESTFRLTATASLSHKSYGEICKSCFKSMVEDLLDLLS
jgi:hypothetical protein